MATIKGKIESINRRDGSKGPYWYIKINGREYYCGDAAIADKQGQNVSLEYYKTKAGNDAVKYVAEWPAGQPAGKREWVPRWRDTEEGERLDKAFSCRTMTMKYAVDLVGNAVQGMKLGDTPLEVTKEMTMLVLRVYMVLHDTVAMGTDLSGSEKVFLDTKVGETLNVKAVDERGEPVPQAPPKEEPATPAQRKEIIELSANLGVVPVKVAKQHIGRAIKNMNDITNIEAATFIEGLKAAGAVPDDDVPF